jgi:hypothetical protein
MDENSRRHRNKEMNPRRISTNSEIKLTGLQKTERERERERGQNKI